MAAPKKAKPSRPPAARLAVIADPHLGNRQAYAGELRDGLNARGRLSLATFQHAVTTARVRGATCLVIAGDLHDTNRPEPAVHAGVRAILEGDLPVIVIPGNHDMADASPASASTALEPLGSCCTIVRAPQLFELPDLHLLCIPFTSAEPMADYVDRAIRDNIDRNLQVDVVVAHVGIYDDSSPKWCATARDGMHADRLLAAMEAADIREAFVGNYHQRRVWQSEGGRGVRRVTQVGTLCPGSFSDAGLAPDVGTMVVTAGGRDGGYSIHEIPGPRFLKLAAGALVPEAEGSTLYVRATGAVHGAERAADVEVVEESPPEPEAQPLPEVEDGAQALAEYAAAKGLAPEVLELARTYWTRAS